MLNDVFEVQLIAMKDIINVRARHPPQGLNLDSYPERSLVFSTDSYNGHIEERVVWEWVAGFHVSVRRQEL